LEGKIQTLEEMNTTIREVSVDNDIYTCKKPNGTIIQFHVWNFFILFLSRIYKTKH